MRWKTDNLGNWKTTDNKYAIIRGHGYRVYSDGNILGDRDTFREALRLCLDDDRQGVQSDPDSDSMGWMRRD